MAELDDQEDFGDEPEQFGGGPCGPLGDRFVLWRAEKHLERAMETMENELPAPVDGLVDIRMNLLRFWKKCRDEFPF